MNRIAATIIAWSFLAGQAAAQAAVPPGAGLGPIVERLEAFVRHEMKAQGLPAVSVALVEGKKIVWARGFGEARPGSEATAETVHRVGSVSKLFTDLAVMQLVEEGKLDLDAPVTTYLPDFAPRNPFNTPITLRQLMAHRSGLVRESPVGNYFDPTGPSLEATVRSLNATTLVHPPGQETKYSNAGIAVVGRAVEVVRGEPFEVAVSRTVLGPLGLSGTAFRPTPAMETSCARGIMWTYDGRSFPAPAFPLGTAPAGNLYSTATDLGRFLLALLDEGRGPGGPIVRPETLRAMWEPQFAAKGAAGFGLGFNVGRLDGHRRVGHNGAIYGFATEVSALPDDGLGVAVVITKDCANSTATRIGDAALRMLLAAKAGKPLPAIETTAPLPPGLARRLEGRYGTGAAAVALERAGDRLFLDRDRGGFRLELRTLGDALIVDDPIGYGTKLTHADAAIRLDGAELRKDEGRIPDPPPSRWEGLIGEYGWDHNTLFILERGGRLFALIEWFFFDALGEAGPDLFQFPTNSGLYAGESLRFTRDASGRATEVEAANVVFKRRRIDGDDGSTFRIVPVRPVAQLRPEALAASPPVESGAFLKPDLVDLTTLDPTIKLDIRYATDNNFCGTPFYSSARAFLQRPAAEALVRAHRMLKERGYGLLIHDAYRPWHVTRMFWDATPESGRAFVADPSKGSRHNRGCAVDLTLYDLKTGAVVPMVGGYDEFSARSSPDYPGGTSRQRWHRDLLRRAVEDGGFTVNEVEWWHFDFKDWPKYPILNATFEALAMPR